MIRVFISSTFRDMHAEREELIKRVFPELKQLCERRQVVLSEVDLRWGVPDEAVSKGELLSICLAEVDNCRPYFIGLLGNRYGNVVDQVLPFSSYGDSWSWIKDHSQKSITEIEIWHGALNCEPSSTHAFFYFRDPVLQPESDESDYDPEDARSILKLSQLKERIQKSGFPVRQYTGPVEAGQLILDDFKRLIDRLFPESSIPGSAEQETAAHRAWAENRARVCVGLVGYSRRLERHVSGSEPPLIVVGMPGSGKSTLLANWVRQLLGPTDTPELPAKPSRGFIKQLRQLFSTGNQKIDFLFAHFVGATSQSTGWAAMLRRIMVALRERFELEIEIPDLPERMPAAFTNWLQAVAAQARIVIVLDGLDQLEEQNPTSKMAWLPETFPPGVRLIVSTNEGETLNELMRRGWSTLRVNPLKLDEREHFAAIYLGQYGKRLSPSHLKLIASSKQAANPLYLRILLEELRVFGEYERLGAKIGHYLSATLTGALLKATLVRLEADYESERKNLVRDAVCLLWASREGLSESEMLDLLGSEGLPLPSAIWSPLYLALRELLVNRSGLYTFFHKELRDVVEDKYLPGEAEKRGFRRTVADYFASDYLARRAASQRCIDELPRQLAELKSWPKLAALLSDPSFFGAAWKYRPFEIKTYWSMIESNSGLRLLDYYQPIISAPGEHSDCVWALSLLLNDTGHTVQALALAAHFEAQSRAASNSDGLRAALSLRGLMLKRQELWREAKELFQEEEQLCRQSSNLSALAANLGNQAVILREQGQPGQAMALHSEEEEICRKLQDELGLSASLGNQSIILQAQNDLAGARKLLREQEQICRRLGDLSGLQKALGNQAILMTREGALEKAIEMHAEEEKLCRELHDPAALAASLGNQALIYEELADYDRALNLLEAKERICRNESSDPAGLVRALAQQARLFAEKLKQPRHALPMAEEADSLADKYELTELRKQTRALLETIRSQIR